jgi:hypothetical protein
MNLGICVAPTSSPYWWLLALRAECLTRVTQQTGNHNERSPTATSRSQQKIRTNSLPALRFEPALNQVPPQYRSKQVQSDQYARVPNNGKMFALFDPVIGLVDL